MDLMINQMQFLFSVFFGSLGIIISVLSFSIFQIFEDNEEKAEISFQINSEKVYNEFLVILFMNAVMMIGFIFYTIWGIIEFPLSWNIGMSIGVLYMVTMSVILFRWWRRFQ